MKVIVTEVTDMSQGTCCVAAYRASDGVMIRPKPDGRNWTVEEIISLRVFPGAQLDLGENGRFQVQSPLPHRNEDFEIPSGEISRLEDTDLNPPTVNSIQDCFGNCVVRYNEYAGYAKAYVDDGSNCPSLSGVTVDTGDHLYLFASSYGNNPKRLRIKFKDRSQVGWNLGVTSRKLHEEIGVDQALINRFNNRLKQYSSIHLRVGLARRFPEQKNRCYLQLNGVLF